ncbi:DUF6814 family protein [Emticicia sp. 21SJ11W-3]|uniref:DUF6814 family protein n=1 Tax=Emticicia sp. 21SJ11W-3 TaxID=2916755 RepID=UPI00209D567E|nr:hypothetical protein [Emticicia sp. 21SJ11W-3]UTA69831.1 hypothetical protein MB380_08460 [Emticicia sp. 21SJ11W-3]
MNALRKILGIIWIVIGVSAGIYLIYFQAVPLWKTGGNDLVPAIIYTFILAPIISLGMSIFGYYAWQGDYSTKDGEKL